MFSVGLLGIEPSLPAPKAGVLPVYDSPGVIFNLGFSIDDLKSEIVNHKSKIFVVPRVRIELTTERFSNDWLGFLQGSDYFISVLYRVRSRALMRDYCWAHPLVSTPSSL